MKIFGRILLKQKYDFSSEFPDSNEHPANWMMVDVFHINPCVNFPTDNNWRGFNAIPFLDISCVLEGK
jgi:hypothetical protein